MNKKALIVAGVIILLIGSVCFAKEYITPEFITGVTTKEEVIKNFRKPDEVTKDKDGNAAWIFKDAIKMKRVDNEEEYSNSLLVLTFNKNGILINSDITPIDEDIQKSDRLGQVCELLQNRKLTKDEKAKLLYEKSYIMLTKFWVTSLRTGTESLLEAIELAPQNKEYKDFLCQAYDNLWKNQDFNDESEFSKDFQILKEQVRIKVQEYSKNR